MNFLLQLFKNIKSKFDERKAEAKYSFCKRYFKTNNNYLRFFVICFTRLGKINNIL